MTVTGSLPVTPPAVTETTRGSLDDQPEVGEAALVGRGVRGHPQVGERELWHPAGRRLPQRVEDLHWYASEDSRPPNR